MKLLLSRLVELHASITRFEWLCSSRDWRYQAGALVLILLAGIINFEIRDSQWDNWKSQQERYFADGVPMVSSNDAAFFLTHARNFLQGEPLGAFESKRLYPDYTEQYRSTNDPSYKSIEDGPVKATEIPLLSIIIAQVATLFTDGNVVLAGNVMIPYSILLTSLAIGVMFWIAGYPAEGAIAAVGTGMSSAFLIRTSIGRIDTDQLFLFFATLCLSFALLAARERNLYRMLGFALLTALSVRFSYWWHANGLFMVVVPTVMVAGIYLYQFSVKRAAIALAVFILFVSPVVFFQTALNFIPQVMARVTGGIFAAQPVSGDNSLIFPDTYTIVEELARTGISDTFGAMAPHPILAVIGVIGFLAWAFLHPRRGLILLPVFFLGMLAFVAGIRFAFFATPFVWFGLAWVVLSLWRWCAVRKLNSVMRKPLMADGISLAVAAIGLIAVATMSHKDYTPRPVYSVKATKGFKALQTISGDDGGVIVTWWDQGYYAHFHSGLSTFHDPGKQTSPRTHLLARGLTSPDQNELIQIIKFVTSSGTDGIERNASSLVALNTAIAAARMPSKPIYLLMTHDMSDWMGSIAQLGRFNVETGQPLTEEEISKYDLVPLKCRPGREKQLQCERGLINMEDGTIDGKPVIGEVALIRNGFLARPERTNNDKPGRLVAQVTADGTAHFALMHRDNWNSSFNQLFHQGRYDKRRLRLVLDGYPIVRIYRILQ